jgi:hypothetical protein
MYIKEMGYESVGWIQLANSCGHGTDCLHSVKDW